MQIETNLSIRNESLHSVTLAKKTCNKGKPSEKNCQEY